MRACHSELIASSVGLRRSYALPVSSRVNSIGTLKTAAICVSGHVLSTDVDKVAHIPEFCDTCGHQVRAACWSCGRPLAGDFYGTTFFAPDAYKRPAFCRYCSTPHPWHVAAISAARTVIDSTGIPQAEKALLKSDLADLSTEAPQVSNIARAKDFVERVLTDPVSRQIYVNVLSEAAKKLIAGG